MSDILIRGMEKPGSCCECDFCEVHDINFETLYFCNRNDRFLDDEEACNIPNDCPIVELSEHGDLVDLSEVVNITISSPYGPRNERWTVKRCLAICCSKPTVIIPASETKA